jgi:hypothetical protein
MIFVGAGFARAHKNHYGSTNAGNVSVMIRLKKFCKQSIIDTENLISNIGRINDKGTR